jgi:hypothetical protein
MYRHRLFGAILLVALMVPGRDVVATSAGPGIVLEWNQIMQDTIPATAAIGTPRYYALAHIAMFDAINSIVRDFEPYRVQMRLSSGSPEAAAAQAAHDVLVAINSGSAPVYDAALASQLGQHRSGFVRRGTEIGAAVARAILEWRQNDGWVVPAFPPYSEPPFPGRYQPTPPNNPTPTFTHLQSAAPLALLSSTQFLPHPPPSLTSERYATDFEEVKGIGSADSATRTEDQTSIARLWAGVATTGVGTATNLFAIWNNVARDVVRDQNLSLVEAARVFALVNVSIHDGLQTTQTSKFVYGFWRPVTAIREAERDLNPATEPEAGWLPLITTPPYPSYAGNMACVGASAARALQLLIGTNDIPITLTWRQSGGLPDVSHQFTGFWEAAEEQSMARIYGGIHYRFDQDAGQQVGRSVAEYVLANLATPR